jgi:hypothetical protein
MKKILIAGMIIACSGFVLTAQENTTDLRSKLMLGLKGGINYSNVYDSQGAQFDANPKLGLAGGAFLAIPIGRFIGIQPEVMYSEKGFQSSGSILGNDYNITRTSTFLDVPLLFAFKPSEFISILAGPQVSYLLNQKNTFANGSTSTQQEIDFDNDDVRKNTLCFTGGVDLTLKHIVLSGRVGWDIQANHSDGSSSELRYKNMWYQATIGYRFYK